MKHIRAPAKHQ